MVYIVYRMFDWDEAKNEELKSEGRPSFEQAVEAIENGGLIGDVENPRYPGQRLMFVTINDYAHVVPYENRDSVKWLITIYPSRKVNRRQK